MVKKQDKTKAKKVGTINIQENQVDEKHLAELTQKS